MTRLAIGDIHGRSFWKNYISENFDEFYFVGDYFDSRDIPFAVQMNNFHEIIKAARSNSRIKLCLGNHDYHYITTDKYERYSGYQSRYAADIGEAINKNRDLFKIVYTASTAANANILISHAGVSSTFMKQNGFATPDEINARFMQDTNILKFNGVDIYGDDVTQSPIWIRPHSLIRDALPGFSQIAGHTPVDKITTLNIYDSSFTLTLIDTNNTESVHRF